ncbi:MAG: hypothetical protein ABJA82_06285 [Myxococcales bacterium]
MKWILLGKVKRQYHAPHSIGALLSCLCLRPGAHLVFLAALPVATMVTTSLVTIGCPHGDRHAGSFGGSAARLADDAPALVTAVAAADAPLAGVVDPWTWPRAADASDRERALEDIGPYEPRDRAQSGSPLVNSNGYYWTALVGLAWDRDVDLDFDAEPVDLDADGTPDMRLTRHMHVKGGILAQPRLFGLVPTPDDPRGRVGRISVSTGVLGLREALTPEGTPSGHIGMTCFLCHGGTDSAGRIVLGLPGVAFDYGLLLATAAVLADDNLVAAAERRVRGFPDGRTVRARLMLAGPGRQDLTGEFGLDVTVPGTHAAHYPGTARVRQGTTGIVNPISVPGILAAGGVDLQNWSGSEVASVRWLRRLVALGGQSPAETLAALELPAADLDDARSAAATRRALLLDLRNLGTLGLQQDSFPGLLWADAIYGHASLAPAALIAVPRMYGAAAIRRVLSRERLAALSAPVGDGARVQATAAAVERGREIFANRIVGTVANRQILKEAPAVYAAAKLGGAAHLPILAPIDEALPPTFNVRCADCHSATPGGSPVALGGALTPLGRCSHCHRAHSPFENETGPSSSAVHSQTDRQTDRQARKPLAELKVPRAATVEVTFCTGCHHRHRPFSPVVYSSSLLLPFDADGDGKAQDDEDDDRRAGGIGTEALLAFDVPRPQRPAGGFAIDLPSISGVHEVGAIGTARVGAGWVRVPPLLGVRATAPYLHNGSVPTLRALLAPAPRRPKRFALGAAGFVLDTALPGNGNGGHEYGTRLTTREKSDLVAYLESL